MGHSVSIVNTSNSSKNIESNLNIYVFIIPMRIMSVWSLNIVYMYKQNLFVGIVLTRFNYMIIYLYEGTTYYSFYDQW